MKKTLQQAIFDRLRDTESRIERGRGDWPDHVWDGWIAEQSALRRILWEAGIDADAEPRHSERRVSG